MANRLKGITLEIGGDTTELSNSLKSVNSEIKNTQSQLKDVEKLLKLDPKNVELLKQKQKLLSDEIKNTKTKLDELKNAQANMDTSGVDKSSTEYQSLRREIIETEQELKNLETQARQSNTVLSTISTTSKEVATKATAVANATKGATVAIAAAGVAAVNAASNWETAFTGVKKTVDATDEEYDKLAAGIQQMATETASSAEDIAGVMEVAGQLGVEGVDNLLNFTKVMVELGDTTNLSAEDAATNLARFMNITGESQENVERLGSAIVDLGNNFATDEASIVEMSTRLASAGTIAGLSSTDILALSTAMSSVGIQAEAGGTAMTQTLTAIGSAVDDYAAGSTDKLNKIASVAGVSAEKFASVWKSSPIEAIEMFISGLGNLDEESESTTAILDELGMSGIRQSNMLKSLALASDVLTDAVDTSNSAYEENTALTNEASKRYETFAAKLSQAKEELKQIGVSIGETLMPYIEKALEKLKEIVNWWNGLSDAQRNMIIIIAAIIALISPVASIIAGIATVCSTLAGIIGLIDLEMLPIYAVILLITAAVIALGVIIYKNWDTISEGWSNLVKIIQAGLNGLVENFKTKWNTLKTNCINIFNELKAAAQTLANGIAEAFSVASRAAQAVFSAMRTACVSIINGIITLVENGLNSVINRINAVISAFNAVVSAVARAVGVTYSGISTIRSIKLPKMATGGVLHNGTALVGEAGPELLTVANGKTTVTPLTATVDSKSLSSALGKQTMATNVNVQFTGSLAQLASVLHPYITAENKRIGGSLVN